MKAWVLILTLIGMSIIVLCLLEIAGGKVYLNQPLNKVCTQNYTEHIGTIKCCGECISEKTASFGLLSIFIGLPILTLISFLIPKKKVGGKRMKLKDYFGVNRILYRFFNMRLEFVHPRHSVKFFKKYFQDKELVGAEIGVYEGQYSKAALNNLNIKRYYLIDPYEDYSDRNNLDLKRAKNYAHNLLKEFNNIEWIEKLSTDALKDIPQLDFIHIDGNHHYKYVKQDLENYYPKIKEGGVISGHDFCESEQGVIRAVTEFIKENQIDPHYFYVQNQDWWIVKEEKE